VPALYASGAVVSSRASLAWNVLRHRFAVVSLGASGAISTVIGAYAYLNPNAELYIIFLPFVALKAKVVVGIMAFLEVVGGAGSCCAFEWVGLGRGGWMGVDGGV